MDFTVISEITHIQTIARGVGVHARHQLNQAYGYGNWRKMKGRAYIKLVNGAVRYAELHWFEAHGIGRRRMKRKRFLDDE